MCPKASNYRVKCMQYRNNQVQTRKSSPRGYSSSDTQTQNKRLSSRRTKPVVEETRKSHAVLITTHMSGHPASSSSSSLAWSQPSGSSFSAFSFISSLFLRLQYLLLLLRHFFILLLLLEIGERGGVHNLVASTRQHRLGEGGCALKSLGSATSAASLEWSLLS